jgi:hypothetical protein
VAAGFGAYRSVNWSNTRHPSDQILMTLSSRPYHHELDADGVDKHRKSIQRKTTSDFLQVIYKYNLLQGRNNVDCIFF